MIAEEERLRRWRLALGADAEPPGGLTLTEADRGMDRTLEALYQGERGGGLGKSSPNVARWLGDIRTYFPSQAVRVMQRDALERLHLTRMLLEPELLSQVEPDVHLVASLLALSGAIPDETKETARQVVRRVVDELERKLGAQLIQAVRGSLNRAARTRRPRISEIDWNRTIRANLKNYLPDRRTIIAEKLVGYTHKRSSMRDIVLCVDQSGSMATSVVYSGIFAAVLATIRAVSTRMIVFDTAVADLTEDLHDPIDLLFGVQLGGGTDINRALTYCQQVITRPTQTILTLITDLYEGGDPSRLVQRVAELVASGVQVICLLALSDDGAPSYHVATAAALASLGAPCFACTPDLFPDLMSSAILRRDLAQWAAQHEITLVRPTYE
jgi:Mg-chelatase subunit ChlD